MLQSILPRIVKRRIFGKDPVGIYLRLNRWIWKRLPPSISAMRPIHSYGIFVHALARLQDTRRQSFGTFFLRNRPQLELIGCLSNQEDTGATLRIAVLACSTGAEVYSVLWAIRSARPHLKIMMKAVDISKEALEFAQRGVYSLNGTELHDRSIFERMTENEMRQMFDRENDQVKMKSWIKEEVTWHLGDAGDPKIIDALGLQRIVVANNFFCHMKPLDAERCLRNVAGLVEPGGYIFVSGIDLDIRTKVALDLDWKPVGDLLENIHNGDPILRDHWPWHYTGLEPINKGRPDWKVRYASAFQIVDNLR